ncbi:MAG: TolC family protein [Flavobacteriaceae bacterium]|nr:TolC family protein [Flavobacteriaceae bacterium]
MKNILLICCFIPLLVQSQSQVLTLKTAIDRAQKESPDYEVLKNTMQGEYWRYKSFKAGLLPQVRLNATLPEYSNSIRRIVADDGKDIFVGQNQSIFNADLAISQNVPFTGGEFSVRSRFERIDQYGENANTNYSLIPFSINYTQNSLLFNAFKWDKKIEKLRYEESQKALVERLERISMKTTNLYFKALKAQMQLQIAKNNQKNQDTLFQIAQGRFKMGKIAENELLQMELALLNSENNLTSRELEAKKAFQDLNRFLGLKTASLFLETPKTLGNFVVGVEKALEEAKLNRATVLEFRRRRLESERKVAEAKGNNRLQLRIDANFGLNKQDNNTNTLFEDFNQQESVRVSLGIPIFDWGVSKARRKMAESNLELTNTNIEQESMAFEQEIRLHVMNWTNQQQFLSTATKAKEVAVKRYDISKKRFILGKITITELNIAQNEKDRSILSYLNSLEKYWRDYYLLRTLTLYDFMKNEKVMSQTVLQF